MTASSVRAQAGDAVVSIIRKVNQSGLTLFEILVALAITSVLTAVIGDALLSEIKVQKRAELLATIASVRLNFQELIVRQKDWSVTTSKTSSMSCFSGSTPTSCAWAASLGPQPLALYSSTSAVTPVYDSAVGDSGYTAQGQACGTFGKSNDCILKPLLTWSLQCNLAADPSCKGPLVIVHLDYKYIGVDLGSIHLSAYGFDIAKTTFPVTPTGACVGSPPVCTNPGETSICEAGTWTCRGFGL